MVVALNKADLLPDDHDVEAELSLKAPAALVSARTGEGVDELLVLIEAAMVQLLEPVHVLLPYDRGDLMSLFYERGQVDQEAHSQEGVDLFGRIPKRLIPIYEPYQVTNGYDLEQLADCPACRRRWKGSIPIWSVSSNGWC